MPSEYIDGSDCDNIDGRNADGDSYSDIEVGGSDCNDHDSTDGEFKDTFSIIQ